MVQWHPPMRPKSLDRYLGLLGVSRRGVSFDALCELVQEHLCRVPFENISKLYYRDHLGLKELPSLQLFLDGIERFNFGSTCYASNYYFYQLLANLGYRAILCGADMSDPDVHLVSIVDIENHEYIVDVGYAAPFLAPLPRDLDTDYVIELGRDRYVLEPQDARGCSLLKLYRNGKLKHGYVVKPVPRRIGYFRRVIADSYRCEATFMNAILLARFFPHRSLVIHNLTIVESRGSTSRIEMLTSRGEVIRAITEHFKIPVQITEEVVTGLGRLEDAWS